MRPPALGFVLGLGLLPACDNRAAFHEPEPTLSRMLEQRRADPFGATSAFPDGKVMQKPPAGTVPLDDDEDAPPPPVTRELLLLGRARFEATCAVCHGIAGDGQSVVATKMSLRAPPSLLSDSNRRRSRQRFYEVTTQGYGLMNGYSDLLSRDERWAVV
jgi:mono/diheme cytochrome c family protein